MSKPGLGSSRNPRITPAIVKAFREQLPTWYRRHHRLLPWRSRPTPYRILVAEFVLQQTRVDQGLPYYHRLLRRFPSLRALAEAPLEEVLRSWEGLGYYRRAHHLHQSARLIMTRHGGRLPRDLDALRALPGIGPYTAAAVGSIAFGLPGAVVDGNVLRVLARVFAFSGDIARPGPRAVLADAADRLLDRHDPGTYNQALMELGSLCCTLSRPDCPACPLKGICRARAEGHPEAFPHKSPPPPRPHYLEIAAALFNRNGALLLRRRADRGLLGGLWELPGGRLEKGEAPEEGLERLLTPACGLTGRIEEHLGNLRHGYSHFQVTLHLYRVKWSGGRVTGTVARPVRWVPLSALTGLPMSRLHRRAIALLNP